MMYSVLFNIACYPMYDKGLLSNCVSPTPIYYRPEAPTGIQQKSKRSM